MKAGCEVHARHINDKIRYSLVGVMIVICFYKNKTVLFMHSHLHLYRIHY